MANKTLGTFEVDVQLQENGLYDVYLAHDGSSGEHYKNISVNEIGKLLVEDIECVKDAYESESERE